MSTNYVYAKDKNWIYKNDCNNNVRYVLGEIGDNPVICIGVNPSTASPHDLDMTLKRVKKVAEYNYFDKWIMLNLYPKRDTYPEKLPDLIMDDWHKKNIKVILNVINNASTPNIWCAWGVSIKEKEYLSYCLKDIYETLKFKQINWLCTGTTKEGHPKHPSRLSTKSVLNNFDIENYVSSMCCRN